jgi:hypothetical protein
MYAAGRPFGSRPATEEKLSAGVAQGLSRCRTHCARLPPHSRAQSRTGGRGALGRDGVGRPQTESLYQRDIVTERDLSDGVARYARAYMGALGSKG